MRYRVTLDTQLGKRCGVMLIERLDSSVSAKLQAFGRESFFRGVVDENGCYRLRGNLLTLMRSYPTEASGSVCNGILRFMTHGGSGVYSISGIQDEKKDEAESFYERKEGDT